MVALLIGVFTSFYPLRLVRAQLLTLRNAEFVDSSRMVGASGFRIIRKDLLPHLVPTLLVWGAVAVATDMLLEVGLSVIGVGVQSSTATWGTLLAQTTGTIYNAGFGGAGAPHDVAHGLADDCNLRLRRLAEPALGEPAPGDRAVASMKRIGLFLARRLVGGAVTVVAIVTVTWLMYWSISPQPGRFVYPAGIKITDFQLRDGAHRLGADRPKVTQYGDWWWHLLHGDFGHRWTGATLSNNVLTTAPIGPTSIPRSARRCRS